jgi:hypothetical protein
MLKGVHNRFSGPVTAFHEKRLPESATPAGYAALIGAYGLKAPLPRVLTAIGARHRIREDGGWRILTPRHAPASDLGGHLTFALKQEGLDLAVLKRLFEAVGPKEIAAIVRAKPTGAYSRRIWFLYEWLADHQLDLPDARTGSYVPIVDPARQYAIEGGALVRRQRVRNNLPGTPQFCPLIFRTDTLDEFVEQSLSERARAVVTKIPRDILSRTAAFLLLKDSKSSFAIEGEHPSHARIQRWGRAIGEAGRRPIDLDELLRLQRILIGDERFVKLGLRTEDGFVGEHDRDTQMPIPDHVSARHEDLPSLIDGMVAFDRGPAQGLDAVIAATILAFGFVYIHPLADGNGRLHRYLIHHVLAQRGFNPPGVVFPVSAAFLDRIDEYRSVLEDYSARLLPLIDWVPAENGNVHVRNDTADFYRFFDATLHAEFLYSCVKQTIERDLPEEAEFLRRYDQFRTSVEAIVDMPQNTVSLLFGFLQQNTGKLSKRAREREFAALTENEIRMIESRYEALFPVSAARD